MIAFFDTNVHIDILRGTLPVEVALEHSGNSIIRLSPIVASELLRGVSGSGARQLNKLVDTLLPIEPPSWRRCWLEAGRLLPMLFADHETIGLARLQNDTLLALTARHTGALLVTSDAHFASIRRRIPFSLKILPAGVQ